METIKMTKEGLEARPLSYSSLKAFAQSPKHFIKYRTSPFEPSPAMILGSAFEDYLFEPEKFKKKYVAYRPATGTGSRAINEAKKQEARDNHIIFLKPEEFNTLELMKESLMSTDNIRPYIDNVTAKQVELRWRAGKTKLPFVGYVDFETEVHGAQFAVDLKTAASADPDEFPRAAYKFHYNYQWAAYATGYERMKYKWPHFAYLAVETVEPYNASLFFIEPKTMQESRDEWNAIVTAFEYCMEHEMFHMGYQFRSLTMPYFSMHKPGYYKPKFLLNDE
jgi:hypothetical protein